MLSERYGKVNPRRGQLRSIGFELGGATSARPEIVRFLDDLARDADFVALGPLL